MKYLWTAKYGDQDNKTMTRIDDVYRWPNWEKNLRLTAVRHHDDTNSWNIGDPLMIYGSEKSLNFH